MPYNQKKFNKENPDNYLSLFYQKAHSFLQQKKADTKESLNRGFLMAKVINTNQRKEGIIFTIVQLLLVLLKN